MLTGAWEPSIIMNIEARIFNALWDMVVNGSIIVTQELGYDSESLERKETVHKTPAHISQSVRGNAPKRREIEKDTEKIMSRRRPRLLPSLLALYLWTMSTTFHPHSRGPLPLAHPHQLRLMDLGLSQSVGLKSHRSSRWPAIRHDGYLVPQSTQTTSWAGFGL